MKLSPQSVPCFATAFTALFRSPLSKLALILGLGASTASAANYYVDPASGSMSNPGTSAAPWSTLEAVFTANKTFAAGDVIYLRNGYHGAPQIKGINGGTVYIQAQSGHVPKAKSIDVLDAARWTISDLALSPFYAGATMTNGDVICRVRNTASYITVQNCKINSVADTVDVNSWSVADWAQAAIGVYSEGPYTQVIGNTVKNVRFGIRITRTGSGSVVTGNTVENFSADAMIDAADDCEFSYNTVMNAYLDEPNDGDKNHDDGFQAIVETGTILSNVTLRGNIFISCTNPAQPHKGAMQGIGCFNDVNTIKYSGWIVENNVVAANMINGITLGGATNCRIVNNTTVTNPLTSGGDVPQTRIDWAVSTGNTIRNNLSPSWIFSGTYTVDHNITLTTANYSTHFVDYPNLDLHLKTGSSAIDAGASTLAPAIDCDQLSRSAPYDVGAFEYRTANVHGGAWSLKSVLTSTKSYSNVSQAPTGIPASSTYVGSVWIKGSGSVQLKVLAGTWGAALATVQCNATSTWTQVTTPSFSTGANTQLTFVLQDQYGTAGTVYIDDAFLGVSGGANKLANPGFESGGSSWGISNSTIWSIGQF